MLGRGQAVPAELRPAAAAPAAAPDPRLAQPGLGAGEVAGGAEPTERQDVAELWRLLRQAAETG